MTTNPEPEDTCRLEEIGGEIIRVHGAGQMSDESREALAALISVAKRKYAAEHPETEPVDPERRERYAEALYATLEVSPTRHPWETLSPLRRAVWYARADAAVAVADGELAAAVSVPPPTREAAWREAADTVEAMNEGCGRAKPCASCDARTDAADDLRAIARRMADEAQQQKPTPCGPVPDQCDDEPCANHEREQAHAEGEHCFCGPECVAAQQQPDTETPTVAALQQEVKRLGLMVDEYGAGASALTTKLKRARDMHRETCPWAQGKTPSPAFRCSMCDVLDAPAMPVRQPASGPGRVADEETDAETSEAGRD